MIELKKIRKEKKLTIQKAAKDIGISWTYLGQIETGYRKGNLVIIEKILNYYGYKLSVIKLK
jgi:transcriptional regulator with XRE-family HTH domain